MVFVGERCYKLHRILFITMGLWPYQKLSILRIQAVFFFSTFFCFLFFQLTTIFTSKCDVDCAIKKISYIAITLAYIITYYSFYFNYDVVKQALEHMQLDWKTFENSNEMEILNKYIFEAYMIELITCIFIILAIFVLAIFECRSVILDIIVPMNQSRPLKVEIPFEFFVDKERYFFLHLVQEIVGAAIGISSISTTFLFLATIGKHCCATYKIASLLIENTVTVHTLRMPSPQRMRFMHENICRSVHIHRRTMKFINDLLISFNLWYLPLLLIGVVSLSCILFRLHNAMTELDDFYDIAISLLLFSGLLILMFVANFLTQRITDHSAEIFKATL
ncbi:uncharacterized protein LOC105285745 isoform X3 [Ooceraea biroi]|uniref:uncharacterized protein LOC105285745 isoform X3 n=1 Tax=Ooceraea biroi TaxID=2015173 RepID=UPI000971704C|nr:uncharacterized protein LOC105285745 isoform X3 [Ooceraea biroi]